jgi:cytochrome b6-f complex iron-sulfur subunit
MKNRRAFIKETAIVCSGALLLGASFSSCSKLPVVKTQVVNNSIVIDETTLTEGTHWIVRASQLENDLLLVRENAGGYHCLLMRCTHQEFPLHLAGNALVCSSHGSRFDLAGNVMKDPATKSLTTFPVTQNQNKITITL